MNNNLKVSILVPVYGVEKYIAQCAESLFEQDYQNLEFVFVNDCTKDRSIDCLKEVMLQFPNRNGQVKIINHKQNKGLAAARNTALDNATGDYVLPFDSDDFLNDTSAVSVLMHEVYSKNADIVFYDLKYYPDSEQQKSFKISLNPEKLTKDIIRRETYMSLCGGLYRKTLFTDHQIRSIESISMGEDYAIKPRLTYYASVISHVKKAYYSYRQENTGAITKQFKSSQIDNMRQCIDGFYEFFKSKSDHEEYEEAIKIAEIRCKVQCLRWWISFNGSIEDFDKINTVFPHKHAKVANLNFSEHILYNFSSLGLSKLVKLLSMLKRRL